MKTAARKPLKTIARHGTRGAWVKVVLTTGHTLVRVQWKEPGQKIRTDSKPNTPENVQTMKAFAEGVHERMKRGAETRPSRLTLQQLWDAYREAEFPHLRSRTRELYEENFRRWALYAGWSFVAEQTTPEMADAFRTELSKPRPGKPKGLSVKTIRNSIDDVKRVFAWAEARELITRNRLRLYRFKVAKEDRPVPPPEYRSADFDAILGALSPDRALQWRAWAALTICGTQGARQNAVLHLQLADVDFERGTITWRAQWDKLGREWSQPLRPQTIAAVQRVLKWHERIGYTGPWLFPSGSSKNTGETYSPQSLWTALQKAEQRAGIPKARGRGAHGLRRMLAGDVAAATGNALLGLRSIGDTDPRMATRYIQGRDDELREAFGMLDTPEQDPKAQPNHNGTNGTGAPSADETPATLSTEA